MSRISLMMVWGWMPRSVLYASWMPRFYAPGTRAVDLLRAYAARLSAVELNNTFYRQPTPSAIAGWLAMTPTSPMPSA